MTVQAARTTLPVSGVSRASLTNKGGETIRPILIIGILVGIASLAAVSCGGDEEEAAPAAAAPAAATSAPDQGPARVELPRQGTSYAIPAVSGVTRREGNVIDFTLNSLGGGANLSTQSNLHNTAPNTYDIREMTFNVGDTVNLTIVPYGDGTERALRDRHTFTIRDLGINESVKYGKAANITITFDKAGRFQYVCDIHLQEGEWGHIIVE